MAWRTPRRYPVRGPGECAVSGCAREQVSAPEGCAVRTTISAKS
jgi:hypothetical protein